MSDLILDSAHVYRLDGVEIPGVSRILGLYGFDPKYPNGDYKLRGSQVHKGSVYIDQGHRIEAGPGIEPYLNGYRTFLKDFKVRWEIAEKSVYHGRLRFAGTVDRFGKLDGRNLLLDIKTGTPPIKRLRLQTAAYTLALLSGRDEMVECLRWGLELKDDGRYKIHNCADPMDFEVFVGLVQRFHWEAA